LCLQFSKFAYLRRYILIFLDNVDKVNEDLQRARDLFCPDK
jgi:hypothetical protein